MITFAVRNLKIFFRDKSAVFFSLLAVFIIIGLYALFRGDIWVESFKDQQLQDVRPLMDRWIVSGLLTVTSVTTTMGAFGIMVNDQVQNITKDFTASPLKRGSMVGGYVMGAFIIGVIMSLVTLLLAQIYILSNNGEWVTLPVFCISFLLILLTTFANTSMVLFVVSFFRSSNAFATASTIIGTLIGFITGIYLPIGQLPDAVAWFVKVFPISHGAFLFRQVLMEEQIETTFAGAQESMVQEFEQLMGVRAFFGDMEVTPIISIAILVGTACLFYFLSFLNFARKRK